MINKEFIEKIEDMTGPKVIETDHGAFSDKQLHRIEDRLLDTTKSKWFSHYDETRNGQL